MRTAKNQVIAAEKKMLARVFAKGFLSNFKRDTLTNLVAQGTLRRPRDLSVGTIFVPQLYNQIHQDMQNYHDHQDQLDDVLNDSMSKIALVHKQSIVKELNKRQEKKKEEMRKKREEEEERKQRKNKRAALRERHRLEQLKEQIMNEVMNPAVQEEYAVKHRVYDVRDPLASNDGIIIVGGLMGELIISFTCMLDYILASPQHQNFTFSLELMEQFLTELLGNEENPFPEQALILHLNKELHMIAQQADVEYEQAAMIARNTGNMADFGLRFLFEIQKDLVLSNDVIEVLYKAVCKLAMKPPTPMHPVPEATEDMDAAAKEELAETVEKVKADNEAIEKENAKSEVIKKKVLVKARAEDALYNEELEKALLKVSNFREVTIDASGNPVQSARTGGSTPAPEADATIETQEQQFNPEKLPPKIPLVKPINTDSGLQIAVYHSEAPYALRKVLMEQARKTFKELEKADVNQLLIHSSQRSKMLEERFEESFIKNEGYGKGSQYTDANIRLTFKTFLQE